LPVGLYLGRKDKKGTEELAKIIGVTPDSVINWEIRDIKPEGRNLERVRELLEEKTFG